MSYIVKVVSSFCRGWEENSVNIIPTEFKNVFEYVRSNICKDQKIKVEEFKSEDYITDGDDGFHSLEEDDKKINYEGDGIKITYYMIDSLEELLSN